MNKFNEVPLLSKGSKVPRVYLVALLFPLPLHKKGATCHVNNEHQQSVEESRFKESSSWSHHSKEAQLLLQVAERMIEEVAARVKWSPKNSQLHDMQLKTAIKFQLSSG